MAAALNHRDQKGKEVEKKKQANTFTKTVPFILLSEPAHMYNLTHSVKPWEKKH